MASLLDVALGIAQNGDERSKQISRDLVVLSEALSAGKQGIEAVRYCQERGAMLVKCETGSDQP